MATQVPAALKSADITRFAHRAAQLETVKPVVAYWCDYWIVNQILSKGLHSTDQECLTYTTTLMDKLEKFKSENQANDAVVDDVAGKAYVEQFGLETFQRADNAVRVDKATRQTADTFQASATFLDLLQIWGPNEEEIIAKIKYAKYHALRIAKAVKAGEDPNLSNPKVEPDPEAEVLPQLDPNDPEVQLLNGGVQHKKRQPSVVEVPDEGHRLQRNLAERSHLDESLHPSRDPSLPRSGDHRASVEHIPDESHHIQSNLARQSSIDESLHPSRAPSVPPPPAHDVSPIINNSSSNTAPEDDRDEPTAISPISPERQPSIGGNYFPDVPPPLIQPTPQHPPGGLDLPSTPAEFSLPQKPAISPPPPADGGEFTTLPSAPLDFPPPPQIHSMPQPPPVSKPSPPPPARHHGRFIPTTQPIPPILGPQSQPRQMGTVAPPQLHGGGGGVGVGSVGGGVGSGPMSTRELEINEEAIMKAQKHARWAISALNFEDVPTAIKELRGALETLGGL